MLLLVVVGIACRHGGPPRKAPGESRIYAMAGAIIDDQPADAFETAAKRDPLQALRDLYADCRARVIDYTCTFYKQERTGGRVWPTQAMRVHCREQPLSVLMEWVENPPRCERLLYVRGRWTSAAGREEAWVDPTGTVPNMILGRRGGIRYEIAKAVQEGQTRRSVDDFGFVSALRLIVEVSEHAEERGDLQLRYLGRSVLADRGTYLFERVLPYTGDDGLYPDRLLRVHVDRELRVPIGVFAYADTEKTSLLGRYVYADVALNPGLPDAMFSKERNGF